jgi:hypothetical protein
MRETTGTHWVHRNYRPIASLLVVNNVAICFQYAALLPHHAMSSAGKLHTRNTACFPETLTAQNDSG